MRRGGGVVGLVHHAHGLAHLGERGLGDLVGAAVALGKHVLHVAEVVLVLVTTLANGLKVTPKMPVREVSPASIVICRTTHPIACTTPDEEYPAKNTPGLLLNNAAVSTQIRLTRTRDELVHSVAHQRTWVATSDENPRGLIRSDLVAPRHRQLNILGKVFQVIDSLLDSMHA